MTDVELADRIRARATSEGVDIVVLPVRVDEKTGTAVYSENTVFLVKRLKAAGVRAAYLDDAGGRTFVSQNSAVLVALGSIGLGIVGSAAYDGLKALVNRIWRNDDAGISMTITDATETTPEQWTVAGSRSEVVATIEELKARRVLPSQRTPGGAPSEWESPMPALSPSAPSPRELAAIDDHLAAADRLASEAEAMLAASPENFDEANQVAIRALRSYRSALNWAEDTDRQEEAHQRMDEAGRRKRNLFGCTLEFKDGAYLETCPVSLGHVRVGLSVGGTAVRVCSLCDEDISECEHDPTQTYLVAGERTADGYCRICMEKDCDEHEPHLMYDASPCSIVTSMTVDEVSLVATPAFRDARIESQDIDMAVLMRELGDKFRPGMTLSCDRCLQDCGGLTQFEGAPAGA